SRYVMLEALRAYGAGLLAKAGEQEDAAVALAGYALRVAGQAAAGLQTTTGEAPAARWLDESPRVLWRLPIHGRVGRWEQHGSIRTSCVTGRSGWCWTWSRIRRPA